MKYCLMFIPVLIFNMINFHYRTYFSNNRRYGYYQPNGYGSLYPGQSQPGQYPGNTGLGDDKFKYDPVSIIQLTFANSFS